MKMANMLGAAALLVLCACATATPPADEVVYRATLRGDTPSTGTGSKATGQATVAVDTAAQTVDLTLAVQGITIDQLWDNLVAAPIGPIHLHIYASHDHSASAPSALLLPVPFGPSYASTADGFTVTVKDYPYAQGAALLKSDKSFAEFVAALDGGAVVLNIHTDAFQPGEISGDVMRAGRAQAHGGYHAPSGR
jgi:hypothetical protein